MDSLLRWSPELSPELQWFIFFAGGVFVILVALAVVRALFAGDRETRTDAHDVLNTLLDAFLFRRRGR
ncbi:hypothetical protein [Actinomadura rudentiformis]|uniref:Uncharacterized protein n=1 Tax=Actinomadura rudentiformis TaxID=359158 RepID=A0A6H9YU70_9ACTN|nr:hypothetical protein [Actinomadura rudentiformis]KAB2344838.1 hypothetical protein F8566_30060 [Actinomadura rudentiformis]